MSTFQLISALLYLIMIIYLLVRQIQSIIRLKRNYFRRFWSYIDLGIIICSCLAIGAYIMQYTEAKRIGDRFQQTNGYVYINLQRSAYINDLQNAFLAFSCFFSCLNLLRLGQ
jgi:glucan phosphoethanolaminetransferase (alkaline phosphatase superfamily)